MRALVLVGLLGGTAAAAPKSKNPCFANKPPIDALEMYGALEKYTRYYEDGDVKPPPTKYGTCRVTPNKVTAANGTLVAELGCGIRTVVPGIRDDLGLEIGVLGKEVLARRKKLTKLTCFGNGPNQVRCRFERDDQDVNDVTSYVVAGKLDTDAVSGEAALTFFATRTIVEHHVVSWCH